ncbi:hypothetical protein HDU96_002953, partial [Phlyctochytrium bullatum]
MAIDVLETVTTDINGEEDFQITKAEYHFKASTDYIRRKTAKLVTKEVTEIQSELPSADG